MREFLSYLFLAFITSIFSFSQETNKIYFSYEPVHSSDSNQLFLTIRNTNFIQNREYFNPFVDGYTLIGFFLRPEITYQPGQKILLRTGVHLMKYSGLDKYSKVIPTFSFHYQVDKRLSVIMGTIYGALNHQLTDPLYKFDRYFEKNTEQGIQVLFNSKFFKTDIWLDWEQFIFKGDPFREIAVFGISSFANPGNSENSIRFAFPFQALMAHQGGQINSTSDPVETLMNIATGLTVDFDFKNTYFKSVGIHSLFFGYKDLSPAKIQIYDDGFGFYPQFYLNAKNLDFYTGYWYGNKYIPVRGDKMFSSVSENSPGYYKSERQLITAKIMYYPAVNKYISLAIRIESYFDLINRNFDYAFGFHAVFNHRFFLKQF
jgi:hypothetical protein